MSDALIASLNQRITELTNSKAEVAAEAKNRRIKLKEATAELETLRAELAKTTAERDTFKAKAEASPGEHAARLKELESKLHAVEVEKKFSIVSAELADGVTLDKVFKAVGFDSTSDGVDKIDPAEQVKAWRASDPYLFKPAGSAGTHAPGGAQRPALSVETPVGRGAPDTSGNAVNVRKSDTANPAWMQANQAMIAAASAAGTLRFVD